MNPRSEAHGGPVYSALPSSIADNRGPASRWANLPAVCVAVVGFCLATSACSFYRPAPLPALTTLSQVPALDEVGIRAAGASLANPLLSSVRLDFGDGLDPEEVAILAVVLNPGLAALRHRHAETRAGLLTARLLPNPEFSGDASAPAGTGSRGLTTAYGFSVSIGTRSLLTRRDRIQEARTTLQQVDLGIAWREWQVAESARLEVIRLAWIRRRLALASQALNLESITISLLDRAVAAGDAAGPTLALLRVDLETRRATVTDLEHAEVRSRGHLSALLGDAPLSELSLNRPESQGGPRPSQSFSAVLPACLARRLDLAALRRGYAAQESRLRRAILEQLPNVNVGLSRTRDETSLGFLGGLVSVGLPAFSRNQGGVARERATRERLAAEYRARVLAARAELREILDLLGVTGRRLGELQSSIGELARVEAAERAAAAEGEVGQLEYQTLRLGLLSQRLSIATLSQFQEEARVAFDVICGVRLRSRPVQGTTP